MAVTGERAVAALAAPVRRSARPRIASNDDRKR
jgi:hypothetical protein